MKKIFITFLLFFLFLNLTGMAWLGGGRSHKRSTATIQGTVIDAETKSPIPDAKVELLSMRGRIVFSTFTNSSGSYQIDNTYPDGNYFLKASKDGYSQKSNLILLRSRKSYTINFSLIKVRPPQIFKILPNSGSTFLAGAKVNIRAYVYYVGRYTLEYQN